ncbi:MAG: response regulator [Phycisphaeraceae bacterium]|nr:response regulator [Phycisphaeraceae bacterium]
MEDQRTRILIVDDDHAHCLACGKLLRRAGFDVKAAGSVDEGMSLLLSSPIDLLILDLEMPVKDGEQLLTWIRSTRRLVKLPVLVCSSTPLREVMLRVARLGVEGIVVKDGAYLGRLVDRTLLICRQRGFAMQSHVAIVPSDFDRPTVSDTTVQRAARTAESETGENTPIYADTAATVRHAAPDTASNSTRESTSEPQGESKRRDGSQAPLPSQSLPIDEATGELRQLRPIVTRSDLLETMMSESASVRALRPSVQHVLRLIDRPDSSAQTVASAVKQDQSLSLRILKMANSTLYGRGEMVDTVQKAVLRIGMEQIRSAVMSAEILDAFSSVGLDNYINPEAFWEHSIAVGLLSMRLSQLFGQAPEQCDSMFTAGLLHDIGRLLYAEQLSDIYPKVIQTAERLELPLELVESRLLQMNHADVTDRLLRHWKFPNSLIGPVAMHHLTIGTMRQTSPRAADLGVPLAFGNRLVHAMLIGSSGNDVIYGLEEFADHMRLDGGTIQDLCARAYEEIADLRMNFMMHSAERSEQRARDVIGSFRSLLGDARPASLALAPSVDPVGLAISRLTPDHAQASDANVITLRICTPADRDRAVDLLESVPDWFAGGDREWRSLPVLVVGNSKGCLPQDGAITGRRVDFVCLPVRISRLISQIRTLAEPAACTNRTAA